MAWPNVDMVLLANKTSRSSLSFDASGMEAVQKWTIDYNNSGSISLRELPTADIAVNIENLASGKAGIGFAKNAISGQAGGLAVHSARASAHAAAMAVAQFHCATAIKSPALTWLHSVYISVAPCQRQAKRWLRNP